MIPAQSPAEPGVEPKKAHPIIREMLEWIKMLAIALVIVFLLTTFVFQIVYVDGTSMLNTLHDHERMLVTKYQYLLGDPQRFDVVICHYPDRGRTSFVKRIVGVPGDTVAVYQGVLYVNGDPVQEPYIDFPATYNTPEQLVAPEHYFVMGDNRANSNDSRNSSVGQLTRDQITGKVRAVVWPLGAIRAVH